MGLHQATASPLVHRYTLDEFFELDAPPGGWYYELIAGVLYMVPPPTGPHHLVASRLNLTFAAYVSAHPNRCLLFVPRTPVWTPADTYLEPDLFLVSGERNTRTERRADQQQAGYCAHTHEFLRWGNSQNNAPLIRMKNVSI